MACKETNEQAENVNQRSTLINVFGVPMTQHIAKNLNATLVFTPDPSDVLISSYPKSGTTWIQEIVDLLRHNGDANMSKRAPTPVRMPFLENCSTPTIPSGLDLLKEMDPPRVIKTHLPIQLVPKGFWVGKCKNPMQEIKRIMLYLDLSLSDDIIDRIVQLTSFEVMKDNPMPNYSTVPGRYNQSISAFLRKGDVGDWKNHFTPEQVRMFEEDYTRQMTEVDIPFVSTI